MTFLLVYIIAGQAMYAYDANGETHKVKNKWEYVGLVLVYPIYYAWDLLKKIR